jgi:hypothetical protein
MQPGAGATAGEDANATQKPTLRRNRNARRDAPGVFLALYYQNIKLEGVNPTESTTLYRERNEEISGNS